MEQQIKISIIGESGVGKTCLVIRFHNHQLLEPVSQKRIQQLMENQYNYNYGILVDRNVFVVQLQCFIVMQMLQQQFMMQQINKAFKIQVIGYKKQKQMDQMEQKYVLQEIKQISQEELQQHKKENCMLKVKKQYFLRQVHKMVKIFKCYLNIQQEIVNNLKKNRKYFQMKIQNNQKKEIKRKDVADMNLLLLVSIYYFTSIIIFQITKQLKLVLVGDGAVGKTCALFSFTNHEFMDKYVPTVFDTKTHSMMVDEQQVELTIADSAGQEDFDRIRPLGYVNTDVFILCYSVISQTSLENIKTKWYPEVSHHCEKAQVILVGMKEDLRNDEQTLQKLAYQNQSVVTEEQANKMAKEIKAKKVMVCSAKTGLNIEKLFEEAARVGLNAGKKGLCSTH